MDIGGYILRLQQGLHLSQSFIAHKPNCQPRYFTVTVTVLATPKIGLMSSYSKRTTLKANATVISATPLDTATAAVTSGKAVS